MLKPMMLSKNRMLFSFKKKLFKVCPFREHRALLEKCAQTTLSSKLIARQREFFSKMVVDAVLMLDELLPLNMYVFLSTIVIAKIK